MAVAKMSILSGDDIELVHAKTLSILEKTGILVLSEKALDLLEEGGAIVDKKTMRARLPENLVKETIRKLPKTVKLCARSPRQDMIAPREGPPYMATNGTAIWMKDLETGERRTTLGKDLQDFMVLCDAMGSLDYVWPIVTAHDAPRETHALSELTVSLQNTTKHVQGEAMSAKEAKAEIEVGAAVVGGEDQLAKRPVFSVVQCPVCPLEFEKGSVEAVIEFAQAGIPVVSMSMALCGLTSPVTLAGTIAIVNAENLASFTISQLARAGAPVVYSSESSAIDMKTGVIHYGSSEGAIIAAAVGQMAKHYGAATMVGGFGVGIDGDEPGLPSDPGELVFTSATCMSLTDFASGIGGLDQAKGAALEQIVIDCDLWEVVRELCRSVAFDAEHFATDVIDAVGPGGSFLKAPHTARNMRRELFIPSAEKAALYSMYRLDRDKNQVVEQAKRRARAILASHKPEQLEKDTRADIDRILKKHQG